MKQTKKPYFSLEFKQDAAQLATLLWLENIDSLDREQTLIKKVSRRSCD